MVKITIKITKKPKSREKFEAALNTRIDKLLKKTAWRDKLLKKKKIENNLFSSLFFSKSNIKSKIIFEFYALCLCN